MIGPQQAAGAPNPPSAAAGPQGSPMAQPTPNDGARQMGMVQVETAMQMLEKALASLGMNTPEGQAAHKALGNLAKVFNRPKSQDLVPAQIAEMARAQRMSPVAQQMAQGAQQQEQQQQAPQQPMPMAA